MSRMSSALPVVLTLAGLALAGCGASGDVGLVTATATTTVRTTSNADAPSVPSAPSASPAAPSGATSPAAPATSAPATTSPVGQAPTPAGQAPPRPAPAPEPEPAPRPEAVTPARDEVAVAEAAVLDLTNAERAANGCPALAADPRLAQAARGHSADMAAQDYFDHRSRDGRGFADRVKAAGHPAPGAENIAAGQRTPEAVVKGWMDSPGHRANILNCKLKSLGVGMARGGSYGIYWTQNFGW